MANPVDVIIGSEAIKQVQNLVNQLNLADAELLKLSQTALQAGKNISGISTPKGFSDSASNNAKIVQDLDKLNAKYNTLHENIAKKAEQSRLAEIRLQQAREKAFDSFEKNAQKEAAINAKNETAYQRIQNSVNILTKTYQDLAIRKELNGTLTANEEKQLASLSTRINTYQTALKKVDSDIQKNQRNVGNYASGWNGLGNSINQLTREMPAFANSMQTGFMAISNNIPALVDEIGRLKKANADLAESGEKPKSILSQLGGAIFSWQSLISVGITLLTVYGSKLIDMAFGLGDVEEALKNVKQQQDKYNSSLEDANNVIDHNIQLEKDRLTRLGKNQDEINNLDKKGAADKLKNFQTVRDIAKQELDLETKKILTKKGLLDSNFVYEIGITEKLNNQKRTLEQSLGKDIVKYTYLARTEKEKAEVESLAKVNTKIKVLETLNNDAIFAEKRNNFIKTENETRKFGLKVSEINSRVATENITNDKKEKKSKRDKVEALNLENVAVGTTIEQMDKYIDFLQTELILNSGNEEAYKNIKVALDQVKQAKTDLITGGGEIISTANLKEVSTAVEEVKTQLSDLQKQYLESFTSEFFSNSGFSETFKLLNDEVDGFGENFAITFNAIAESAQEAFNFISNASQANFDAERDRLQNQYDIALGFANGNKAAEEKLATDLEKRKKEIANREAKAKQKQAIFNIAIDTAQAVVAALPNIPLSIVIGALGAVQIGLVAAQKIPQYAEGTDYHSGGLMLVNDAKGSSYQEKVILPNGKEIMPQGRNVLMDAPAGTKVLTPEQQLMEALNGTNIKLSKETINRSQGMTAEQMDYVLGKHFGNITTNTTIFDEIGMRTWSEKNGNKTISTTNRVTRTGIRV